MYICFHMLKKFLTYHEEDEWDLLLVELLHVHALLVAIVDTVVVARGRREEGRQEDHLGELGHRVDEARRHALPEGAVLRQAQVLQGERDTFNIVLQYVCILAQLHLKS